MNTSIGPEFIAFCILIGFLIIIIFSCIISEIFCGCAPFTFQRTEAAAVAGELVIYKVMFATNNGIFSFLIFLKKFEKLLLVSDCKKQRMFALTKKKGVCGS